MADLNEYNKKKSHALNIINIWKFIVNIAIYSIVVLILIVIYITFHIFVIRYCLFGLLIGCAVSYGLGKNKYANKKILCFLIFLSAVFIIFLHLFFHDSISKIVLQKLCLSFFTYVLFFSAFSFFIIKFVSCYRKKTYFQNKNEIFVSIVLFSFIFHIGLSIIYYYLFTPVDVFIMGYWKFLYVFLTDITFSLNLGNPEGTFFYKINSKIITLAGKLTVIITILSCIAEFIITVFSAWKFAIPPCPLFLSDENAGIED